MYPRQTDEECLAGAIVTAVQFMASFSYSGFTFPKITSLVIVFGNVLKIYGHCMLAAFAVCLLWIRYRKLHFNVGKIYHLFKDQGKSFVKILVLFPSMCLIYFYYTRQCFLHLLIFVDSLINIMDKGKTLYSIVSPYSSSIF